MGTPGKAMYRMSTAVILAALLQGFQILVSYTSIMNPSKNAFSSV